MKNLCFFYRYTDQFTKASYSKKISSWSFVPFILSNFDNYFMCIHVFRVRNNIYNWKNNFGFEKINFYHHFHWFCIDFIVIFEKSWKSWKISCKIPKWILNTNLKFEVNFERTQLSEFYSYQQTVFAGFSGNVFHT